MVVVGGHERSNEADQLSHPIGLFFDRYGHLYVSDSWDDRV